MNLVGSAGRIFVPAAVALVFALSKRYLPPTSDVRFTTHDADEFSRLQWLVGAFMLLVGTGFGVGSYKALLWANAALADQEAHSEFLLLPTHWMWLFLPLSGALCLTWDLTLRFWRLIGDPLRASEYESWTNSKVGFDASRVLHIMSATIVLPIAIATILALPIHSSIGADGMFIGHFATLQSTPHRYADISRITVTDGLRLRDGSLQRRPAITLDFRDGTRWSSANNRDPEKFIDYALLNLLQEKTHCPVRHIEAFPFGSA